MTGIDYQRLAMRTNDGKATSRLMEKVNDNSEFPWDTDVGGILNGCLGLSGEVGEFNDMVKKWIFHEKEFDPDHAMKELGDVLWYVAMICHSFGWNLNTIMQMNVDKLKARYPEGFDVNKSAHRLEGDV